MTIDVLTFGCRLNAGESDAIRLLAARAGLDAITVVNTCAVTNEAVAQARQAIRRLKRAQPQRRIVVTGCAAQTQPRMFAAMAEVDRVVGNDDKLRAESWRATRRAIADADDNKIAVSDIMAARGMRPPPVAVGLPPMPRAFVQVQNGCDHRCTFCVIPFGRGNARSLAVDDAVAQVRAAVARGHAEIVLTGVDLTSYGGDLPGAPTLGMLVKRVLREVTELQRLRISSIDSIEADRDLLDALANEARLMPHLHLSLQSGDDLILKRMKRRHRRADAIAFAAQVRRLRPDIALGADFIAGFPTESDDAFERSLELVEQCGLTFLHVFPYSARPGTPAARMPQVPGEVIRDRARRLREAGAQALRDRLDTEVGKTRAVLIEGPRQGRTEHFLPVAIAGQQPGGALRAMTVTGHDGARLTV